jgi:heme/copper-type cytochrome/quinol oxidase subunit 2
MIAATNARGEDVHEVFLAMYIMILFVVPGVMGTSVGFVFLCKRTREKENGDPLPDRRS